MRVRSRKNFNGAGAGAGAVHFSSNSYHISPITILMRFKVRFYSAVLGAVQ